MADKKTQQTKASVNDFVANIAHDGRRADSKALIKLMRSISGEKPCMWGPSIIGFGEHYYRYASGKETSICKIGFSPRVNALSLYLASFPEKQSLLKKLGKHKTSKACLYINKLDDVDLDVLRSIIEGAWHKDSIPC